jgi:hypothetical protein
MMNSQRFLVVLVLAGLCAVAAAPPAQTRVSAAPGPRCGGTLWKLMTLSDAGRASVKWSPSATTVGDIAKLVAPARTPTTRSTSFQKQIWQVTAVVDRFRMASNGEYVLVLYDVPSAKYMNAYIPDPTCLPKTTRGRTQILAARAAFDKACSVPTAAWQTLGATVKLTGAGYWNPVKSTKGALPSGAELRPVTALTVLQGCGK